MAVMSAKQAALDAQGVKDWLATTSTEQRNHALKTISEALLKRSAEVIAANDMDVKAARDKGTEESLIDRLLLDEARIKDISKGLLELVAQADPLSEVLEGRTIPGGIVMKKVSVPLGVVAMIYEARPNVTVDAAGIGIKTGNAMILRGGSMAYHSNEALTAIIQDALDEAGFPRKAVQSLDTSTRETATELMGLSGLIDVLIPRGGAGLIASVVKNAKVPVIETGTGNCHVYVHESADLDMAQRIVINAKTQRPSVCNATETLLLDKSLAENFLVDVARNLTDHGVEIVACKASLEKLNAAGVAASLATDEDFATEFLGYKIAIALVEGVEAAIKHINHYSSHHTEAIVTSDLKAANTFSNQVDSSTVFVNASTRFTDGGMFGLGAEIGISTQKLHARGPMGLKALTSTKFVLVGDGQVRS